MCTTLLARAASTREGGASFGGVDVGQEEAGNHADIGNKKGDVIKHPARDLLAQQSL